MPRCLISFGANIGDARATIQHAASQLKQQLCSSADSEFRISRNFLTPPVGGPTGQPPFINAVAALQTAASVWDVWHCIRRVEQELGRVRSQRWEARRIDLDILLYDDVRIWTPHLKVPHPRMCMRRFILLPAVDVAADWIDPVSRWTVGQLADDLRTGAGNLVLLAEPSSGAESLLAEVARQTGAQWLTAHHENASHKHDPNAGRWVTSISHVLSAQQELNLCEFTATLNSTKLVVVMTPPVTNPEIAWEDFYLRLGRNVGICEPSAGQPPNIFVGPRYLLMSDDHEWATAELVAALEAMDCPIEAL